MEVQKEKLVKLYETVGYKKAPSWNDAKLISYLPKLQEVSQEDVPTDKKELKLYKSILLALGKNEEVGLAGGESKTESVSEETPKPKKNGKKTAEQSTEEVAEDKKPRKKSESTDRPGIIQAIADIMKKTSKKNSVTHAEVLAQLVEKFPNRPKEAMAKTLSGQIPTGLMRTRGMEIGWDKQPKQPKKYFFKKPEKAKV